MRLLIDTTVLIDVLRGEKRRRDLLAELVRAGHTLATSTLNIAEVYAGMRPGEEGKTEAFLQNLQCFELSVSAARVAGRLKYTWSKKGRTLGLDDAMVAAVAIERECELLTDNRKDFPMPELRLYPLN